MGKEGKVQFQYLSVQKKKKKSVTDVWVSQVQESSFMVVEYLDFLM